MNRVPGNINKEDENHVEFKYKINYRLGCLFQPFQNSAILIWMNEGRGFVFALFS